MKTPTNSIIVQGITSVKAFPANYPRIISFLLVGLTLGLALTIANTINLSKENQFGAEDLPMAVSHNNALEMQYAQPWIEGQSKVVPSFSNALEMQYAQPWLKAQKPPVCHNRLDLFYACQNGLDLNGS